MKRRDFIRSAGAFAAWLALPTVPRPPLPVEVPPEVFFTVGGAILVRERIAMKVVMPQAFALLRTSA